MRKSVWFTLAVMVTVAFTGFGFSEALSGEWELELPHPPESMREVRERLKYVLSHYWDNMDWTDSAALADEEFMGGNTATYLDLAARADSAVATEAYQGLVASPSLTTEGLDKLMHTITDYLFEPESPVFNLAQYHSFLRAVIDLIPADYPGKMVLDINLSDLDSSAPGASARDFNLSDGRTLYDTLAHADTTLVVFYDPSCRRCMEALGNLKPEAGTQIVRCTDTPDGYLIPAIPTIYRIDRNGKILGYPEVKAGKEKPDETTGIKPTNNASD